MSEKKEKEQKNQEKEITSLEKLKELKEFIWRKRELEAKKEEYERDKYLDEYEKSGLQGQCDREIEEINKVLKPFGVEHINIPKPKSDYQKLAEIMFAKSNFVSIQEQLYVQQDNIYVNSKKAIDHEITKYYKGADNKFCKEVRGMLERWTQETNIKIPAKCKRMDKNYLPFENGVFNIKTQKFVKWEKIDDYPDFFEQIFTYKISTKYEHKWFTDKNNRAYELLLELANGDEDVFDVLCEVAGACIYKGHEHEKAFFLKNSSASNGKTTFLNLLAATIGEENCCYHKLQNLSGFTLADLENRLLNICDDLPARTISSDVESTFKELTSGTMQSAAKKFADPKMFTPYVSLIFACNNIPKFLNMDNGLARRMVVVPFDNRFDDKKSKRNKCLSDSVKQDKELQEQFLQLAIYGLLKLKKNNFQFTKCKRVEEMYNDTMLELDPIKRFYVQEVIYAQMDITELSAPQLYDSFKSWARRERLQTDHLQARSFTQQTKKLFNVNCVVKWSNLLNKSVRGFEIRPKVPMDYQYMQEQLGLTDKDFGSVRAEDEVVEEEKPTATQQKLPDEENPLINKSIPF